MRARLLRCFAALFIGVSTVAPLHTAAAPNETGGTEAPRIEAMQERWQGRRSLYDDDQRGAETVGERPADARACVNEPVRMRRSDGSTVVRRFRRCD